MAPLNIRGRAIGTAPLKPEEITAIGAVIGREGSPFAAARALSVNRHTLIKAAQGGAVQRGVAALIRAALASHVTEQATP
jgi:hypothetical protein